MTSTPAPPRLYTAAEVEAMEDPIAFELDHGELVERQLGAESGIVTAAITSWLFQFLRGRGLGYVVPSEVALHIYPDDLRHFRRADVAFVRKDRLPGRRAPKGSLFLAPELVVEVLSPNDKAVDVQLKVQEYLDAGVLLVWVVYPETRSMLVYRQDGTAAVLDSGATVTGEDVLPGFECAVRDFFPED